MSLSGELKNNSGMSGAGLSRVHHCFMQRLIYASFTHKTYCGPVEISLDGWWAGKEMEQ